MHLFCLTILFNWRLFFDMRNRFRWGQYFFELTHYFWYRFDFRDSKSLLKDLTHYLETLKVRDFNLMGLFNQRGYETFKLYFWDEGWLIFCTLLLFSWGIFRLKKCEERLQTFNGYSSTFFELKSKQWSLNNQFLYSFAGTILS